MEGIHYLISKPNEAVDGINRIPETFVKGVDALAERCTVLLSDQLAAFKAGLVIQFHSCACNFAKNTNSTATANQITYFAWSKIAGKKEIIIIGAGFPALSLRALND